VKELEKDKRSLVLLELSDSLDGRCLNPQFLAPDRLRHCKDILVVKESALPGRLSDTSSF
jgi:hypothetical protein